MALNKRIVKYEVRMIRYHTNNKFAISIILQF